MLQGVSDKLENEANQGKTEQRKAILRRLEMELEEADEIVCSSLQLSTWLREGQIAQMDIEVSSFTDKSIKPKLQVKLRAYKAELAKRKADIVSSLHSDVSPFDAFLCVQKTALSTTDRSDLLSGGKGAFAANSAEAEEGLSDTQLQRNRLLSGTDKLQDSSRRLEESHRLALETEDVGAGILGNLRGQREQIQSTRDRLHDADRGIDRASGTLGKMIRR